MVDAVPAGPVEPVVGPDTDYAEFWTAESNDSELIILSSDGTDSMTEADEGNPTPVAARRNPDARSSSTGSTRSGLRFARNPRQISSSSSSSYEDI